jgi:molybdopterin synthase sulfur carrier subunit
MKIQVRYFASLREALGPQETVELPEGSTVGQLRALLQQRSASHGERLDGRRAVRAAVNQALCDETRVIDDGAEVAFFPPVTGG